VPTQLFNQRHKESQVPYYLPFTLPSDEEASEDPTMHAPFLLCQWWGQTAQYSQMKQEVITEKSAVLKCLDN